MTLCFLHPVSLYRVISHVPLCFIYIYLNLWGSYSFKSELDYSRKQWHSDASHEAKAVVVTLSQFT